MTETPAAYLPTLEEEAFLRLVFDPRVQAGEVAGGLRGFDPGKAGQELCALLPLLAERWGSVLPEPALQVGLELRQFVAFRNKLLLARLAEVLEQLARADIPALALKGAALIDASYADPGLRFMHDADILVPRESTRQALELLASNGWTWKWPRQLSPMVFLADHSIDMTSESKTQIDLHWHPFLVHWRRGAIEPFWERSRPCRVLHFEARSFCHEDLLLHTCVHGGQYDGGRPLRWIADAMSLLHRHPGMDWDLVCREAEERQFVLVMKTALHYLAARYAAPVPDEILKRLETLPVSDFERADHFDMTTPRGGGGWTRAAIIWRRYRALTPETPAWLGWPKFPSFLRHHMRQPSFASMIAQLVKGRLN